MEPKKWLRSINNGNVYEFDESLMATGRYEEYWEPPLLPPDESELKPEVVSDRMTQIIEAVRQIDKRNWSKPIGNRPAMPKVAAVAFLCGFQVSAAEVETVVRRYYK